MLDRTDIDALLVGALYGELSAAEEARLTQHLESHPTDKVVLDDLTAARAAVRDSRIFAFQFEPPQAVSAILLQEAHRRAPKPVRSAEERESWFARFVRVFAAHPAMAAAAMLVLVVGVAGTMYARKGDSMVAKESAPASTAAESERTKTTPTVAMDSEDRGGGDRFAAGSGSAAYTEGYGAQLDDNVRAQGQAQTGSSNNVDKLEKAEDKDFKSRDLAAVDGKPQTTRGIVVAHVDQQPKDLDYRSDQANKNGETQSIASDEITRPGIGNAGGARVAQQPDKPAQEAKPSNTKGAPPAPPSVAANGPAADPQSKEASDASLIAWANTQKQRLDQLVKAKDCNGAAQVALAILNRAPDYYHANVETDRSLAKCKAYIDEARQRDNEQRREPAKMQHAAEQDINTTK